MNRPRQRGGESPRAREAENLMAAPSDQLRVLLVEDEDCVRQLFGEMLELIGYRPTPARNPDQALCLLEVERFDLILSDYRMPGMDGEEFYEAVRRAHPGLVRRMIFLTGDTAGERVRDFLERTRAHHLGKPCCIRTVQQKISEVLRSEIRDRADSAEIRFQ